MKNYWPKLKEEDIETPLSIISEQGSFLEEQTKGVLTYVIDKDVFQHQNWPSGQGIRYDFYIRAPHFNDFKFLLFSVVHDLLMIYPSRVRFYSDKEYNPARDKQEFDALLQEILGGKSTASILQSLLSQSKV